MSSRRSTLSLNQKLTLFMAFLAVMVALIAGFVSGHDWFSPSLASSSFATETPPLSHSQSIKPTSNSFVLETLTANQQNLTDTATVPNAIMDVTVTTTAFIFTSTPVSIKEVPDDIPGAPIQPNMSITSVLDQETKKRDVFSIQLNAGQNVYVTVNASNRVALYYAKPGFETFVASDGIQIANMGGQLEGSFIAATSGTYYIMVKAFDNGIKYELQVVAQ